MTALLAGALVLLGAAAVRVAVDAGGRSRTRRRLASPSAGRRARSLHAPVWFAERAAAAALPVDTDLLWTGMTLGVAGMVAAGAVAGGLGLGVVLAAVAGAAPALAWMLLRHRRDAAVEAAIPEALEVVARVLRAGGSLAQAIDEAAGNAPPVVRAELAGVAAAVGRGSGLIEALDVWAARRPLPGVRLTVAALALGIETGGAQARAVDGVAATLRERHGLASEARALATQARVSAGVIALAPLVFCSLAVATDPRVGTFLTATPLGAVVLLVGLGLDGAGAAWMARLTRLEP